MDNFLSRNWSFIFLLQKAVCLVHQTLYLLDDLGVQCYFFQSLYVLGTSPLPEKWLEGHLSRSVGSLRFGDNSFCCAVVPWFHVILFVKFLKLFPELESWSSNPCLCLHLDMLSSGSFKVLGLISRYFSPFCIGANSG